MKILGIVDSYRRQGNTEVLVKEALMAAEDLKAEVDVMRLHDYNILPCRGCMRCESGRRRCHLDDDYNYILDRIYGSDALILGSATYFLEPPAPFKLCVDRIISLPYPTPATGKPVGIIGVYANRGNAPYIFVQPNLFFGRMGMKVVNRVKIQASMPGDAALDEYTLNRARQLGNTVAKAAMSGDMTYRGQKGICPICHDQLLIVLLDNRSVECPTCGLRGKLTLKGGKINITFSKDYIIRSHHGSAEAQLWHHMYHVEPATELFFRTKEQRKAMREKYRNYLPESPKK